MTNTETRSLAREMVASGTLDGHPLSRRRAAHYAAIGLAKATELEQTGRIIARHRRVTRRPPD